MTGDAPRCSCGHTERAHTYELGTYCEAAACRLMCCTCAEYHP